MSKHLHTARGAESGVLAALLAREGFTGPDTILEGEKGFFVGLCPDPIPEAVTADPHRPWELTRTSIKPWPCCRHTHPAIDAAIELHGKLAGTAVRDVQVGAYQAAIDVCDRPEPGDPYSAKFSLQHTVAIALAEGRVVQESFGPDARKRMEAERRKVTLLHAVAVEAAYPAAWGVELSVEAADGRRLSVSRREAKGDPENQLSRNELSAKAKQLLAGCGSTTPEVDEFVAAVLALVADAPVRTLCLFDDRSKATLARSA